MASYLPLDRDGNPDRDFIARHNLSYDGTIDGMAVYDNPNGDTYFVPLSKAEEDDGNDDSDVNNNKWASVLGDDVLDSSSKVNNTYKGYGARGNNWGPSPGANNNYGKGDYNNANNNYGGGYTDPNRDYSGGFTNPDQSGGYADSGRKYGAGSYANSGQMYRLGGNDGSSGTVVNNPVLNGSSGSKGSGLPQKGTSVTDSDIKILDKGSTQKNGGQATNTAKHSLPVQDVTSSIGIMSSGVLDPSSKYSYFMDPNQDGGYRKGYDDSDDFANIETKLLTGTDIFTTDGEYIGRLNSQLPFQIHFIDLYRLYYYTNSFNSVEILDIRNIRATISSYNQQSLYKRFEISSLLRSKSSAYIDLKSAIKLKDISNKSAALGGEGIEIAYHPIINANRVLDFEEFEVPPPEFLLQEKVSIDSQHIPIGVVLKYFVRQGGDLNQLIGYGHTHVDEWLHSRHGIPRSKKSDITDSFLELGKPTPPSFPTDRSIERNDYARLLSKRFPLFISSPLGFTIYTQDEETGKFLYSYSTFGIR